MNSDYAIDFTISFTGRTIINSATEDGAVKKFLANLPIPDNSNVLNFGITHVSILRRDVK